MIIYPKNWKEIGQPIKIKEMEDTILQILSEINCNCLSLSGGLDSSLMLYFMLRIYKQVKAFTIGISELHPDIKYSKLIISEFGNQAIYNLSGGFIEHKIYIPNQEEIENAKQWEGDLEGDQAVRMFYEFVGIYTDEIIACDGIDEFLCGYYDHQMNPTEWNYYRYMEQLQESQLEPLNKNSGKIKIYLPYLDNRLLLLFSQIPISEKVDSEHRKKIMIQIARDKIPDEIINRRKYGFCDVFRIKESDNLCE